MNLKHYRNVGEKAYFDELENGLRIAVIPKAGFNKKMAFFATDYGGADRRFKLRGEWVDTPAGVAHFLEHKLFEMEDGRNALTVMSQQGASANAFTSSDMTAYYFESIDNFKQDLELLLKFVSVPYFTEESVKKEQGIIGQEIKMTEDEPDHAMYYGLLRGLFAKNPVRDTICGSVESIAGITPEVLYTCHKAFYQPSNMTLVVVGDEEPNKVKEMAAKIVTAPIGIPPERDYGGKETVRPHKKRTESAMEVGSPMFLAGAKTAFGIYGTELLRHELTASLAMSSFMGRSSAFFNRLYSKGLINDTFSFDFETTCGVSYLSFGGDTKEPDAVFEEVMAEAGRFAERGPDKDFFERRKNAAYGGELRALNSFDNICYNVACATFAGYDFFDTFNVLRDITAGDVQKFVGEYITPERMAISIIKQKR